MAPARMTGTRGIGCAALQCAQDEEAVAGLRLKETVC